jgi:hypothetical protein
MANRITERDLEALAERINKAAGTPVTSYTKGADGCFRANIGNYHIGHAYGGVCLMQMTTNEGGGCRCPIGSYHSPKRDLYERMQAFLSELEAAA